MKHVQKFSFTTFELKSIHFLISHEYCKILTVFSDESEYDDKYLCATSKQQQQGTQENKRVSERANEK